jgi:hypothetical protein
MAISQLLLILVSQQYAAAGATGVSSFQALGAFMLQSYDTINPLLVITFSLGALMLYFIFYQSRLIPRWLSLWGGRSDPPAFFDRFSDFVPCRPPG